MPSTWSRAGSLPSDRIRSQQPTPPPRQQTKGKGKAPAPAPAPPRSGAVRTLESRLDAVRRTSGQVKDPKGGCFCQAREHDLSNYVPICRQCGLILCTLNTPYYACPHCGGPLLDESHRAALIVQLEDELREQLAREEAERQRAIDMARAAEGDFPVLLGSQPQRNLLAPPAPQATRTVLSLNAQTKKVMVSSYTSTPASSRPASRSSARSADVLEDGERRVPAPPGEVSYVKEPRDASRPWRNVKAGDVRYVAPPVEKGGEGASTSRRKKKGGEHAG